MYTCICTYNTDGSVYIYVIHVLMDVYVYIVIECMCLCNKQTQQTNKQPQWFVKFIKHSHKGLRKY